MAGIVVHVWESAWVRYLPGTEGHGSPGHASIQIDPFNYVSWWPGNERVGHGRTLRTLQEDLDHYQKANQQHWQTVPPLPTLQENGRGLDQNKMLQRWHEIQTQIPNYTVVHHCSWVVHELLYAGGGDNLVKGIGGWWDRWQVGGIWSPRDVKLYVKAIQNGLHG
jgi:hypothetical protein